MSTLLNIWISTSTVILPTLLSDSVSVSGIRLPIKNFRLYLEAKSVAKLYLQQYIAFFIPQEHSDKHQHAHCFRTFFSSTKKTELYISDPFCEAGG